VTPPGSACSISIGEGLVKTAPGSAQGLQLVVDDIEPPRAELAERRGGRRRRARLPVGSFVFFSDPDGNGWSVQEVPPRARRVALGDSLRPSCVRRSVRRLPASGVVPLWVRSFFAAFGVWQ